MFSKRVVKIDLTFSQHWVRIAALYSSGNVQRVNNKCTGHNPVDSMTRLKWSFQKFFFVELPFANMVMKHCPRFASPLYIINITGISSAVILAAAIWAALSNTWRPGNSVTHSFTPRTLYSKADCYCLPCCFFTLSSLLFCCCCSRGAVGNEPNLQMLWPRQWMPVGRLI